MQITHLGHAAVLIETAGARVLIDPGNFSTAWHGLTDLDAIVVTHLHPDHLDPEAAPALVAANPMAKVLVEPGVLDKIADGSLPPLGEARAFAAGDQTAVGDLLVTGVGGRHAVIHADLPRLGNVGVVLGSEGEPTFFHPGDALDTVPAGVDILAVPAYGPWAAMKETIDFVRAVGALEGLPHPRRAAQRPRPGPDRRPDQRDDRHPTGRPARRDRPPVLTGTPTRKQIPVKPLSGVLLALYLLTLLWLVLFKLSYDVPSILANYQTRSLNLIPFVTFGQVGLSETVSNFVTFIPFGLLLGLNFKQAALWRLLLVVFAFSVAVETLQFIFAIGTTDATDVVTNTLGGLVGLVLYRLVNKVVKAAILDRVIAAVGMILFVTFILLRLLVFKVRY